MCLTPRSNRTRKAILKLMKAYPLKDNPTGVPYRALLEEMRPSHHKILCGLEELLASNPEPTTKLTGTAVNKFAALLISVEDCVRRGPRDSACDQSAKIVDGYIPTIADVQSIYRVFDQCGHQYVEQQKHQLGKDLESCVCGTCPAESVPRRINAVLSKQPETLALERHKMLTFTAQLGRSTFKYAITAIEHRGYLGAMSELRSSIGLGSDPANPDKGSIPYHQILSPEILRCLDNIHLASEMSTKAFQVFYVARLEPVSDQYFVAVWAKEVGQRLSDFLNDIRNYIKNEVYEMLKPELPNPLPRIKGVGVFALDWNVVEAPPKKKLDLDELTTEFNALMRFGLDQQEKNPARSQPPPKPRRPPTPPKPRGARLMPRPLRSKSPRKTAPSDGGVRAPRRRPPAPPA